MKFKCPKCNQYIDEELTHLIYELNRVGLRTKYSCTGHDGVYAYIIFEGDCIKDVEYGVTSERYEGNGKQLTIKWKLPKYPQKEIRCANCHHIMKLEE